MQKNKRKVYLCYTKTGKGKELKEVNSKNRYAQIWIEDQYQAERPGVHYAQGVWVK